MSLEQKITQAWYQDQAWIRALLPLTILYKWALRRRRRQSEKRNSGLEVPVVVVGNITVGGTGKTPLIIHLGERLGAMGLSVGVIARGYGAKVASYPQDISRVDSATQVGDEPLMIHQRLGIPVVIDPDRYAAAKYMLDTHGADIILSDDGMQHYALPRDLEILLVDAKRELGNELLLPAGPLREPLERLRAVDFCLLNGSDTKLKSEALKGLAAGNFCLQPTAWVQISRGEKRTLAQLDTAKTVTAVAGIGNPQRFFDSLKDLQIEIARYQVLDDHQPITEQLLLTLGAAEADHQILMTTKDAVKCQPIIAQQGFDNCWALEVGVQISPSVERPILHAIQQLTEQPR